MIIVKFELSKKTLKNGRRPIKVILHEIHESNDQWNENGITWKREYVKKNLSSIQGASITAEFVNEERTEILGHGNTGVEDGLPVFENASMIGVFTKGFIDEIEVDGKTQAFVGAEGYIDELRYKNYVKKLESEINNGNAPSGSVEILGLPENENIIIYEDGWKKEGRVPSDFLYSSWAVISVKPASPISTVLEINNKDESEGLTQMDEKTLKEFVDAIKTTVNASVVDTITETNNKNGEYEGAITELNAQIVELNATVEQLTSAMAEVKKERDELWDKADILYKEKVILEEEIAKAKVKERVGELNAALVDFTDEEKVYAKDEIEAFNADPINSEINSIVGKISVEIVKRDKEEAKRVVEINSAVPTFSVEDIFSDITSTGKDSVLDMENLFK